MAMKACSYQEARKMGQNQENLIIQLPPLRPDDPLFSEKEVLLAEKGFNLTFPLQTYKGVVSEDQFLDAMLKVARLMHLNEIEWYFMEEDDEGPFSPRNEIEALRSIHLVLCKVRGPEVEESESLVGSLIEISSRRLHSLAVEEEILKEGITCQGDQEFRLISWAAQQGVQSKLNVLMFEGFGRGGAAVEDIKIGDLILEIPQHVIICEDMVIQSNMFEALKGIELSGETMALLWSMRERHDPTSKFAPYFASLPDSFNTGLSFEFGGLKILQDTIIFEDIVQAKEHIRYQYDSLFPALSKRYPLLFPEDFYSWDAFLWACELWYSNGLKIVFPDGTIKTCLIPILGFLNHGLYPHITHYSKIDPMNGKLNLHAVRPCNVGQQCFLSYGAFPSSHLLTFYGFMLDGDNPYDKISIDLDFLDAPHQEALVERSKFGFSHMVRGSWLSKSQLSPFGLPTRLLAALRIVVMEDDEARTMPVCPRYSMLSVENEVKAVETLLSILYTMLDSVGSSSSRFKDADTDPTDSWDVSLATSFKDGQRRLLQSVCQSCHMLLNSLSEL